MSQIKRAIVFVHYDRDNLVDAYVYFYLEALKQHSTHLVFVTTSILSKVDYEKVSHLSSSVIERENIGYDFMSYKVGLMSFDYTQYDELLICNDSVYGPIYPLENSFKTISQSNIDFWGMTDNHEISHHLQSYFIVFKEPVLKSQAFKEFWHNVEYLLDKKEIISSYEVGLSHHLLENGFQMAIHTPIKASFFEKVYIRMKSLSLIKIKRKIISLYQKNTIGSYKIHLNLTLTLWKKLLLRGKMPFIKIALLRDNPMQVDIKDVYTCINKVSEYDTTLITNHLTRMKSVHNNA